MGNSYFSLPPTWGGLGTLAEPVKYEPRETACRMAEGDMSLRTGIKSFVVEIKKQ